MNFPFPSLKLPNKGNEEYSKIILFTYFHYIPFSPSKRGLKVNIRHLVPIWIQLILRLCFRFFFFWEARFRHEKMGPVGPLHCSQNPQISFFNKIFIKNGSYGTIYTFKNYFATMFSVLIKISGIQTQVSFNNHIK